jgi:hypothetical protein
MINDILLIIDGNVPHLEQRHPHQLVSANRNIAKNQILLKLDQVMMTMTMTMKNPTQMMKMIKSVMKSETTATRMDGIRNSSDSIKRN